MGESFKRKSNRIQNYDYSQDGVYFITVCTKDNASLFGEIAVAANSVRHQFSDIGLVVDKAIANIPEIYETVEVDRYVIMPNHVHVILTIYGEQCSPPRNYETVNGEHCSPLRNVPTISRIIKQFKGAITKQVGFSPWQKSFHDHVIRNQEDYNRVAEYIENNPARWTDDQYYIV